jgi:hypothetical protein
MLKAANGATLQSPDADGNVTLTFSDGQLDAALVKSANLSLADLVTKVPASDPIFTMVVNRSTGAVTGKFTHPDGTAPPFQAIICQKGASAAAYGFFLTPPPIPVDHTGEGGGVTITGQP